MKQWQKNLAALCLLALSTLANATAWRVDVDTSSIAQQNGLVYFSLASLLDSPPIEASVSQFNGALGAVEFQDGAVSGSLSQQIKLSNQGGSASSYLAQALIFGQKLSFVLNFSGDWQQTPSQDGSSFVVQLLDSNYTPLLGNTSGSIFELNSVAYTPLVTELGATTVVTPVPEPESYALLGLGLVALLVRRKQPAR
jgi:hypothetical protein